MQNLGCGQCDDIFSEIVFDNPMNKKLNKDCNYKFQDNVLKYLSFTHKFTKNTDTIRDLFVPN